MSGNSKGLVAVLVVLFIAGAIGIGVIYDKKLAEKPKMVTTGPAVTLKLHVFIPPPANPYKTFLKPWAPFPTKCCLRGGSAGRWT